MRVISLVSEKGGVGKTATAINLSHNLSQKGYRVLAIDLDHGTYLTRGLGHDPDTQDKTSYQIFTKSKDPDFIDIPSSPNLKLIPATDFLAALNMGAIIPKNNWEFILRDYIQTIKDQFDYIVIDCPGSLLPVSINAMAASTDIFAIVQAEFAALESVPKIIKTLTTVWSNITETPRFTGILITMYNGRLKMARDTVNKLRENNVMIGSTPLKELIFTTEIRRNTDIAMAYMCGLPVSNYRPNCMGDNDYQKFTDEVLVKFGVKP